MDEITHRTLSSFSKKFYCIYCRYGTTNQLTIKVKNSMSLTTAKLRYYADDHFKLHKHIQNKNCRRMVKKLASFLEISCNKMVQ